MKSKNRNGAGRPSSYPGKDPRPITIQLTKDARMILKTIKRAERKRLKMKRDPSTGDVVDGLLRHFGHLLVLPAPGRIMKTVVSVPVILSAFSEHLQGES